MKMEKRYIKENKIKFRNQIVLFIDTKQIINPTHEILLENGWEEYIEPTPTEEELLEEAKRIKSVEIKHYDSSDAVNTFYMGDYPVWLDKATRAGLILRFEAEKAKDVESTTLWYENIQFPLQVDTAIQMLYAIELYASACYDNTQKHLCEITKLTTKEDVESYDYTTGYPEKLIFPFEL